jgi:hypothetical protein
MNENTELKATVRKSFVLTFSNHPPIRLWGYFSEKDTHWKYISAYEDGCLWDSCQDFGHHTIDYYVCKSGKRIYWASFNSGEYYGGHEPRTRRTFLGDAAAIQAYFRDIGRLDEWNRVSGDVNPDLIVDSDLL